jgi:hypothetical protein
MKRARQLELPIALPQDSRVGVHPAVIVWIDILGFKELLLKAESRDPAARRKLRKLERLIQDEVFSNTFPWRHDAQLFSDTLVIVFPFPFRTKRIGSDHYSLPFELGLLQCKFLQLGFLVRGAVARGKIVRAGRMMTSIQYSPLYVRESKNAIVPRLLYGLSDDSDETAAAHLSEAEVAGLPGFDAPLAIASDQDGEVFIDYLACSGLRFASDESFLLNHRALIELGAKLHAGNRKILGKLHWMARYHNHIVKSRWFFEFFPDCALEQVDLLINMRRFSGLKLPIKNNRESRFYINWDKHYPY